MTFDRSRQLDFWMIWDACRTSSSALHPARTRASPTQAGRVSTASAQDCSSRPCGWCARCDQFGAALRTSLASELGAMTGYTMRWKRQATKSGRSWWVLGTPARRTGETAFGLLPSPRETDADRGGRGDLIQAIRGNPNKHFTMPTPRSCSGLRSRGINQTDLQRAMLPTPTKQDSENTGGPSQYRRNSLPLNALVMMPTPAAQTQQGGVRMEGGAGGRASLPAGKIGTAGLLTLVEWMMGYPKAWLAKC